MSAEQGGQSPENDAAPAGAETEGIKARLTKALHAERTEGNTLHVDCWACEAVTSDAIYVEVWNSYHLGREHALAKVRAKIDRHVTESVERVLADRKTSVIPPAKGNPGSAS